MKKYMVLTAALFILMSCTKIGRNITVKGRVLNPLTGEGYGGKTIRLVKDGASLEYEGGFKEVKKTYTDENGYFEINATNLGIGKIILSRPDGFDYKEYHFLGWYKDGKYNDNLGVKKGKKMNVDYHLVPYGKLQMHIFNQNCQGLTDTLDIFFDGSDVLKLTKNEDANNHIGSVLYQPIVGCWDKTGDGFDTQMGRRFYHWTVKRGNETQTFYDTVYVKPNETTILNVFY